MAITPRHIAHATTSASATTLSIPGVTPLANERLMLAIATGDVAVSAVSGCGLTWSFVSSVSHSNTGANAQVSLWTAQGASPTTDTVVITIGAGSTHGIQAILDGFAGALGLGTVHTQQNTSNPSVNLVSLASSASVAYGTFCSQTIHSTPTAGAGYTELDSYAPTDQTLQTQEKLNTTTVDWATAGDIQSRCCVIGVEVKNDPTVTITVGLATEADTALAATPSVGSSAITVGLALETDTALAVTPSTTTDTAIGVGIAVETDTALPVSISRPVTETFTGREPKLSLGCGSYRIMLTERGGINPIAFLPFSQLTWGRVVDDASSATITVPLAGRDDRDECCAALTRADSFDGEVDSWSHEITVIRDGKAVWVGPIVGMKFSFTDVQIECRDLFGWFDKRLCPISRDVISDLAVIFQTFAEDALNQEPSPNINLVGYATNTVNRRKVLDIDFIRAGQVLREIGKDGVDFTMVGRNLYYGDVDQLGTSLGIDLALPQYAIIDGTLEKRGIESATQLTLTGQPPGGAAATIYGRVGGIDPKYGLVQEVQSESFITVPAFLIHAAQSRLAMIKKPPKYLDVTLDPKAPFLMEHLIAGLKVDCNLEIGCAKVNQVMRLHSMQGSANVSDKGEETETITLTLVPKGELDLGLGFDLGFPH